MDGGPKRGPEAVFHKKKCAMAVAFWCPLREITHWKHTKRKSRKIFAEFHIKRGFQKSTGDCHWTVIVVPSYGRQFIQMNLGCAPFSKNLLLNTAHTLQTHSSGTGRLNGLLVHSSELEDDKNVIWLGASWFAIEWRNSWVQVCRRDTTPNN